MIEAARAEAPSSLPDEFNKTGLNGKKASKIAKREQVLVRLRVDHTDSSRSTRSALARNSSRQRPETAPLPPPLSAALRPRRSVARSRRRVTVMRMHARDGFSQYPADILLFTRSKRTLASTSIAEDAWAAGKNRAGRGGGCARRQPDPMSEVRVEELAAVARAHRPQAQADPRADDGRSVLEQFVDKQQPSRTGGGSTTTSTRCRTGSGATRRATAPRSSRSRRRARPTKCARPPRRAKRPMRLDAARAWHVRPRRPRPPPSAADDDEGGAQQAMTMTTTRAIRTAAAARTARGGWAQSRCAKERAADTQVRFQKVRAPRASPPPT